MRKELIVVEAGLIIGEFDLETKEIFPNTSVPLSFSCSTSGRCCTDLKIPISDMDILTIEKLGYALDQIVEQQSPILKLPLLEASEIDKYYWMKRKAYTNTCRFLGDDNLCEIYDSRPLGCRIFPFSIKHLTRDKVQIRIHASNHCNSVKVSEVPGNEQILQYILDTYLKDLREKIEYFEKYGNEV